MKPLLAPAYSVRRRVRRRAARMACIRGRRNEVGHLPAQHPLTHRGIPRRVGRVA